MNSFSLSSPNIVITDSYKELLTALKEHQVSYKKIDPVQISFSGKLFEDFPEMDILVIHIGGSIRQVVFHFIHQDSPTFEEVTSQFQSLQAKLSSTFGPFQPLPPKDESPQSGILKTDMFDDDEMSVIQILYELSGYHENIRVVVKPSQKELKRIENQPKKILLVGSVVFFLAMFLTFGFGYQFDWTLFIVCLVGGILVYVFMYLAFFVFKLGTIPQYPKQFDRRLTRFEKKFHEIPEAKYVGLVEVGKGITHGMVQANLYFFHTHLLLTTLIMGKVNIIDKFYEDIESIELVQNMIHVNYGNDVFVDIYLKEEKAGTEIIQRFEQKQAQQKAFER